MTEARKVIDNRETVISSDFGLKNKLFVVRTRKGTRYLIQFEPEAIELDVVDAITNTNKFVTVALNDGVGLGEKDTIDPDVAPPTFVVPFRDTFIDVTFTGEKFKFVSSVGTVNAVNENVNLGEKFNYRSTTIYEIALDDGVRLDEEETLDPQITPPSFSGPTDQRLVDFTFTSEKFNYNITRVTILSLIDSTQITE